MSRVAEAMSAIDAALRLGKITEEMANELKNRPFQSVEEFSKLYTYCTHL